MNVFNARSSSKEVKAAFCGTSLPVKELFSI
jgi:hypothetical protein